MNKKMSHYRKRICEQKNVPLQEKNMRAKNVPLQEKNMQTKNVPLQVNKKCPITGKEYANKKCPITGEQKMSHYRKRICEQKMSHNGTFFVRIFSSCLSDLVLSATLRVRAPVILTCNHCPPPPPPPPDTPNPLPLYHSRRFFCHLQAKVCARSTG